MGARRSSRHATVVCHRHNRWLWPNAQPYRRSPHYRVQDQLHTIQLPFWLLLAYHRGNRYLHCCRHAQVRQASWSAVLYGYGFVSRSPSVGHYVAKANMLDSAGCLWAAFAKSYHSFLGARMVQGLSMAYFESVLYAFIGDIYFVHERGTRTAMLVIMYQSISNIPALASGKLTENMGWRWVWYLLSIFVGIGLLLAFFFGWETSYNRVALDASAITTDEVRHYPYTISIEE
jgi:MFS family permease